MSEEKTTLTQCYVGFLDLMGVRTLVEAAARDAKRCNNVIAALQETKNISSFFHRRTMTSERVKSGGGAYRFKLSRIVLCCLFRPRAGCCLGCSHRFVACTTDLFG